MFRNHRGVFDNLRLQSPQQFQEPLPASRFRISATTRWQPVGNMHNDNLRVSRKCQAMPTGAVSRPPPGCG